MKKVNAGGTVVDMKPKDVFAFLKRISITRKMLIIMQEMIYLMNEAIINNATADFLVEDIYGLHFIQRNCVK